MKPQIVVNDLCKVYRVPEREAGLGAAVRSLFHRRYRDVLAVDHITFTVQPGEIVGFIGPNGAGKTTTLKMLAGLLYPTSGEVRVDGCVPAERKPAFLRRISMVMGNRNQLAWDNTVSDSLYVLGEIYGVPRDEFSRTRDELVELLEIGDLLSKMPRDLSLGERMKCELIAALLHRPRVLFLDEPTLGLDVTMQFRLRRFVAEYNRRSQATVILTSHYMADVVSLCPRVVLIHQGRLLFDGELSRLAEQMAPFKLIRLAVGNGGGQTPSPQCSQPPSSGACGQAVRDVPQRSQPLSSGACGQAVQDVPQRSQPPSSGACGQAVQDVPQRSQPPSSGACGQAVQDVLSSLAQPVTVIEQNERRYTLRVKRADASSVTARLLNDLPLADITVEDPPIEAVIDQVYREGVNG